MAQGRKVGKIAATLRIGDGGLESIAAPNDEDQRASIHNHLAARLSELDMRMVRSVPEGGNWRDIPLSVPSKRLEQIRASFARGEGSRSTYYGRLSRDDPSYTISTYFTRPGNGCHVHYSQDRVISAREAARLQSFPDRFQFFGSQSAVCTQIGNAVPPLLAFRIAKSLGVKGRFIDLFAGAGGMGLGFKWAGWDPVIANDISAEYLRTYAKNVHDNVVVGSISSSDVFDLLVSSVSQLDRSAGPLWVLGGPPCQGFSTAGNARTMEDPRNHLAFDYVRFLETIRPDGFVFENVTGLLSMEGGRVFESMKAAFSRTMSSLVPSVMAASEHGVPQRRRRVILVGSRRGENWVPPSPVADYDRRVQAGRPLPVGVQEALSDLPALVAGQNGELLSYTTAPSSTYQSLMRGLVTPQEFIDDFMEGVR